ncbi:MAG: alpha/beta fold hydrolase [Betaproteobacteria bacterium]|nr:alpha/beta fold hydrolase [Betaproteobacteria bacterium]
MAAIVPWLAGVAVAVAGFALLRGLLHQGIRASLAAPRIAHEGTPAALGLGFEAVRIDTANRRRLHGWLILPAAPDGTPHPAVIVIHGWGGNAAMMLPLARPLHEAGFAVLFIDARCHGASDGDSFASLPRFAEDLEQALAWLAARAGIDARRIAVFGHSVGAGAALLAASRRSDVAAVVSVAAFSHPAAMMRRWLATKRIPERPLGRYILDYVQRTIGHRFDDIAPVNTLARVRCPVLLVHGADDDVVPLDDARRIFAARTHEAVELLVLGGNHDSFADLEQHMAQLVAFLRRATTPRSGGGPPRQGQLPDGAQR